MTNKVNNTYKHGLILGQRVMIGGLVALALTLFPTLHPLWADSPLTLSASSFATPAGRPGMPSALSRIQDSTRTASEAASLEGSRRQTALLIDGSYDFHYDSEDESGLRPYLTGGLGLVGFGMGMGTGTASTPSGDTVPVARLGGGVVYRLDEQWNLSLDYRAGFSGSAGRRGAGGDGVITGRSQTPIDLQSLNLGMKVAF